LPLCFDPAANDKIIEMANQATVPIIRQFGPGSAGDSRRVGGSGAAGLAGRDRSI
jgi:hypothetical protein